MPKRILLVDDEKSTLFFIGENLAELGEDLEILTADSGKEALRQFTLQPFDLVISDLRMPQMDGITLFKMIRETHQNTHLILMTAYGSEYVQAAARDLNLDCYITKPFRVEDLLEAAQAALVENRDNPNALEPRQNTQDSRSGN
jgi:two-component system response regulator GlrR